MVSYRKAQFYLIAFTFLILSVLTLFSLLKSSPFTDKFNYKIPETFNYYPVFFAKQYTTQPHQNYTINIENITLATYSAMPSFFTKYIPNYQFVCNEFIFPVTLPPLNYSLCNIWIADRGYNCSISLPQNQDFAIAIQGGQINISNSTSLLLTFNLKDNQLLWLVRSRDALTYYIFNKTNITTYLASTEQIYDIKANDTVTINFTNVSEVRVSNIALQPIGDYLLLPFSKDCVNYILNFTALSKNTYIFVGKPTIYAYAIKIYNPNSYDLNDYQIRLNLNNLPQILRDSYIMVTDSSFNLIPFCYEQLNGECSNSTANWDGYIWVRVPYIPANGNVTLYLYTNMYKDFATSGENVFLYYYDYNIDGQSVPTYDIYFAGQNLYNNTSGGYLNLAIISDDNYAIYNFSLEGNYSLEAKVKITNVSGGNAQVGAFFWNGEETPNDTGYVLRYLYNGSYPFLGIYYVENWTSADNETLLASKSTNLNLSDNFYIVQAYKEGDYYNISIYDTNYNLLDSLSVVNSSFTPTSLSFFIAYSQQVSFLVDWLRVRNYAKDEPDINYNLMFNITIYNPNAYDLNDYQVRIDLSNYPIAAQYFIVSNVSNCSIQLPFCYEQPNGECNTTPSKIIWVKIPTLAAQSNNYLYICAFPVNTATVGSQVFDFYDAFDTDDLTTNYVVASGNWTIENGYLVGYNYTGDAELITNTSVFSCENCTIEARIDVVNKTIDGGIIFRAVDSSNYWLYKLHLNSWQLYNKTNGELIKLAEGSLVAPRGFHIERVDVIGDNATYFIGNNEIANYTGVTQTTGGVGFETYGNTIVIDWLRVRKIAESQPEVTNITFYGVGFITVPQYMKINAVENAREAFIGQYIDPSLFFRYAKG